MTEKGKIQSILSLTVCLSLSEASEELVGHMLCTEKHMVKNSQIFWGVERRATRRSASIGRNTPYPQGEYLYS